MRLPLNKAVTFNCKRPNLIPQEGFTEAVITIASDGISTPLQFQLPPISRHKLNSDEFDELSSRLTQEDLKLADRVEKIENPQQCETPIPHCVCKNDTGGTNLGVVEICLKTCPGGRVSGITINRVVVSEDANKTQCGKIGSTETW